MEVSVTHLPASTEKMQCYRKAQSEDTVCSAVRDRCHKGWPEWKAIPTKLFPYWKVRGNLSVDKTNLLLFGKRIVIPKSLRRVTLEKIHTGHQGIQRCRFRAGLVAGTLSRTRESSEAMSHMCTRLHPPPTTDDPN